MADEDGQREREREGASEGERERGERREGKGTVVSSMRFMIKGKVSKEREQTKCLRRQTEAPGESTHLAARDGQ